MNAPAEQTKDSNASETKPQQVVVSAEQNVKKSSEKVAPSKVTSWVINNALMLVMVILPVACSILYFGFIASDRYVSTAEIIVKDNSNSKVVPSAMDLLLAGSSSNTQDALLVVNYLHSLDLIKKLDQDLNLKAYYQSNGDALASLPSWASQEDYLDYFRSHFAIVHDELSGIITLEAQSFSPEFAQELVTKAIQHAEVFVNSINVQLAKTQLEFVDKELKRAQDKLIAVRQEILAFQDDHNIVSPEQELQGVSHIIQELELRLAEDNTKLSAYRSYLNENSSQVKALKASIESLKKQISEEKRRLVGSATEVNVVAGNGNSVQKAPLNKMSAEFQRLELQQQFALDAYQLALASIESARIEATNQLKHLVIVTQPSRSEDASYPKKLYNIFTIAAVLIMLYAILRMLIAAIRDHRS